jgi:hypothetical protein
MMAKMGYQVSQMICFSLRGFLFELAQEGSGLGRQGQGMAQALRVQQVIVSVKN